MKIIGLTYQQKLILLDALHEFRTCRVGYAEGEHLEAAAVDYVERRYPTQSPRFKTMKAVGVQRRVTRAAFMHRLVAGADTVD